MEGQGRGAVPGRGIHLQPGQCIEPLENVAQCEGVVVTAQHVLLVREEDQVVVEVTLKRRGLEHGKKRRGWCGNR